MQKNYKKIILAIIVLVFLANAGFAYALEITTYPYVPGVGTITKDSSLGQYVRYFFGLAMYLAGAIAVISLAFGAVQYIMSAGNPGSAGDAIDRIKGSILGMVLLLVSFMILQTINPALTTPTMTPLEGVAGVFYAKGKDLKPAPMSEADTSATVSSGFGTIRYVCAKTGKEPNLLVWTYPKTNFQVDGEDYNQASVTTLSCDNNEMAIGGGSFRMVFETPGIYYYLDAGCQGFRSGVVLSSEQEISTPFKGRIKSIGIINNIVDSNNALSNTYYGFVLHKAPNFDGACTLPTVKWEKTSCINVSDESYSTLMTSKNSFFSSHIFVMNLDWKSSGRGIVFYSKPFGWKTGARAGKTVNLNADSSFWQQAGYWYIDNPSNLKFDYSGTGVEEREKQSCSEDSSAANANFKKCPGSIEILGNYLVALYAGTQDVDEELFCQVFQQSAENLKSEKITPGDTELLDIYAIPTK